MQDRGDPVLVHRQFAQQPRRSGCSASSECRRHVHAGMINPCPVLHRPLRVTGSVQVLSQSGDPADQVGEFLFEGRVLGDD